MSGEEGESVMEQARRLLDEEAGHAMVKRFIGEWFGIESRDFSGRVSPELASAFVEEVDRRLYQAKRQGRNRISRE